MKLIAWYDNEWGYSSKLLDLAVRIATWVARTTRCSVARVSGRLSQPLRRPGRIVGAALAAPWSASLRIVGLLHLLLVAGPAFGRKLARGQRFTDGATRFGQMPAVAKATGGRDGDDVIESLAESLAATLDLRLPHPQLAHAGRVDEERSTPHDDQLTVGGRVAAPGVALAHLTGALGGAADQRVDQRRFAHARHANQGQRLAGRKPRLQLLEPDSGERAGENDRDAGESLRERIGHRPGSALRSISFTIRIGCGAALLGDGQVAPDARLVDEASIARALSFPEGADDPHHVDVGGDDLGFGALARRLTDQAGATFEEVSDDKGVEGLRVIPRHPVPDLRAIDGFLPAGAAAAEDGLAGAALRPGDVALTVSDGDPRRDEVTAQRSDLAFKLRIESDRCQGGDGVRHEPLGGQTLAEKPRGVHRFVRWLDTLGRRWLKQPQSDN